MVSFALAVLTSLVWSLNTDSLSHLADKRVSKTSIVCKLF